MSVSTDGQLCFGVVLEEDAELPWDKAGDVEEWWRTDTGYTPPWQPFTAEGAYAPGVHEDDPRFGAYFQDRRDWDQAHPPPVELVNYCSGDYPQWILAVPGTVQTASRGYPVEVKPEALTVDPERLSAFRQFVTEYGLSEDEPGWWLSSYWG